MGSQRIVLETDSQGRPKNLPKLPPESCIEAIFMLPDDSPDKNVRTPAPELASITTICGDILKPAIDETDWEALG